MTPSVSPAPADEGLRRHGIGDLVTRSAARHPDKIALVFGSTRYTYRALEQTINRAANALSARGIRRGERVALFSRNNDAYVILYFALARLGALSVPINFMLNASEVAYILGHCGARGLIVQECLHATAAAALQQLAEPPTLCGLLRESANALPAGWQEARDWLEHPLQRSPHDPVPEEEPIQIMYTSGTESRPKGAVLSSRNLLAQYASCIIDGEMSGTDIELHALPLYHCAQLHAFLCPGLYLGATNILLPGAEPACMLELIERERITKLFCPPTVWIALLRHADFARRDLSSLAKGYYGAAVMPPQIIRELHERLPGLRLFNVYGQTEMSPLATVLKPQDQLRKLGSAGRPVVHVETRVVDEQDRPVPPGTTGEIVHRGPQVMLGYWNDPEKNAAAFRNGWFHSGDLGVFDEEGYLRVLDRKKDMIKSGGENVASREVEEVLYQHPAVAEAAVIGMPDERWIEAVTAAVVLRPGSQTTAPALIGFCRARLAGFKTPKKIVILERLPKNASGKILKRELRTQLAPANP
jgi:fatty-acyl-CoA synthase